VAKRITEMFAFVCTDEDGDEGVIGYTDGINWFPMVGADMARVESLMPMAQTMVNTTKSPIRILRFGSMELIGEVNPQEGTKA
jgi:hypothetical protein